MSYSAADPHEEKLCCVVQSIGKLYGKNICKQCLKNIINKKGVNENTFPDILALLNAFTLHGKT
jgi:hypothetical protein